MPIYRTNSDRGLWKKYREEKPQHFHKACYLNQNKDQPQVRYYSNNADENTHSTSAKSIYSIIMFNYLLQPLIILDSILWNTRRSYMYQNYIHGNKFQMLRY